jgi:hypothetical protein
VASLSRSTAEGVVVDSRIADWLTRWTQQVGLYGVAYFHLELDELLSDESVRQEFVTLLRMACEWVRAQGAEVPSAVIHSEVGGDHWLNPRVSGWPTTETAGLLHRIREMVLVDG